MNTTTILEYAHAGATTTLDRENGTLSGVKILGLTSLNSRTYSSSALEKAQSLYENAKVNVNHPKRSPFEPRDYQDRIGNIQNVKFRENDGLYADFHFNPHHPLAEQFMWDAEHAPENVGFSHNILARTAQQSDGTMLVEEITAVRSVDLVADPATTHGLFEAKNATAESSLTEAIQGEIHALREDLNALRNQFQQVLQFSHAPTSPVSRLPEDCDVHTELTTEEFVKRLRK